MLEQYLRERREAAVLTMERANDTDVMWRAQGQAREAHDIHDTLFQNRSE